MCGNKTREISQVSQVSDKFLHNFLEFRKLHKKLDIYETDTDITTVLTHCILHHQK